MHTSAFPDQELSLVPGIQSKKSFLSPVSICFLIKLLPVLSYFFLSILRIEDSVVAVITLIFLFVEFVFIKYIGGFNLVGLKWSIDLSSFGFQWYSKPESFVPLQSNTNFFWMSFFTFLVIWLICFFIAFFSFTKIKAVISLVGFICEGVNLYMFSKALNYSKKQVEKAALDSMQVEVHFDLVPENDLEANDKVQINDDQNKSGSYSMQKKTSKVLDTTSVELPPPLMPANTSENKPKNEEDKDHAVVNSDHENIDIKDVDKNNGNDNIDIKDDNINNENDNENENNNSDNDNDKKNDEDFEFY